MGHRRSLLQEDVCTAPIWEQESTNKNLFYQNDLSHFVLIPCFSFKFQVLSLLAHSAQYNFHMAIDKYNMKSDKYNK